MTGREFQLLQFLLDHPRRYFTVNHILSQAWAEAALFPVEVPKLRTARTQGPCGIGNAVRSRQPAR